MAVNEMGLSTLGIEFGYAVGSTKPSSFTKLDRIVSIGEAAITNETIDVSCLENSWEILFCYADARICLTVFQQDVVTRIVFLDQAILQQQSILFRVHHGVADVPYLADKHFGLEAVHFLMEIRRDTVL